MAALDCTHYNSRLMAIQNRAIHGAAHVTPARPIAGLVSNARPPSLFFLSAETLLTGPLNTREMPPALFSPSPSQQLENETETKPKRNRNETRALSARMAAADLTVHVQLHGADKHPHSYSQYCRFIS